MICPKCGNENINGSTFCIKCGINLKELVSNQNINQQNNENVNVRQDEQIINNLNYNQVNQPTLNQVNNSKENNNQQKFEEAKKTAVHYFKYAKDVLLNPYKTFKEKEVELTGTKNALIFSGILAVVMMLITLLTAMITSIFVKELSAKTFELHTVVKFSNLGDLNYLVLIGRNLLIYAGIIAAIAGVYYIISLIFKKESKFTKLLSISATSIIPFIALGMILSPILSLIWTPLSIIAKVGGLVYSILVFMSLIKEELSFETKDLEIKFHLICLTILGTIGYYLYIKLFMAVVNNGLNDLLNMFK